MATSTPELTYYSTILARSLHSCFQDGGGTVDRDELHDAMEEMGMAAHKKAIRECLDVIDTDGDGEISITEFMEGIPEELEKAMLANLDTGDIGDIQDSIRKEVDCLAFTMRAASEYVRAKFDPICVQFPGILTAGVVYTKQVSERSERALRKTRILAMNPAKFLQTEWLHSKPKLTLFHSIRILLTRFIRFALAPLKMRLASLDAAHRHKHIRRVQ